MQYGFYFDNTRCTGCRTCVAACKDYKDLAGSRTFRRVIDYEGGEWTPEGSETYTQTAFAYHISLACNHCNNPACVAVCPTEAMHKDEQGLVWPDWGRCIGCGYCTMACPYHVPVIDQEEHKSSKCDGCRTRIAEGKESICVEACPLRALEFKPVEVIEAEHPDAVSEIPPLPSHSFTSPNLYIKPSPAVETARNLGGHIANFQEIQSGAGPHEQRV
jgi:anaerobic dimethyl sulfoxide reductase subunit B (iron-sulfur subunit)/Tat-targeted selenate reductase subunit YnfG